MSNDLPIRRTVKACASCRRDKIRCDGERPCLGCIKKGKSSQCVDGCTNCRQRRAHCSGGEKPCEPCRRDGLDCVDDADLPTSLVSVPSPSLDSMRSNRSFPERARLACANCRRDNKKCDDARPCSRCVSRKEECVHVERGPKLIKLRCEACRKDNKRCEESRPCTYCQEKGFDCTTQPRKGKGQGSRVKVACLHCRRDKIRCDGQRPCAACTRRKFECVERPCQSCIRTGNSACTHRRGEMSTSPTGLAEPPPPFLQAFPLPPGLLPGQILYAPAGAPPPPGPGFLLAIPSPPGTAPMPPSMHPDPISSGSQPPIPMQLMYIPCQPGQATPGGFLAGENGAAMMAVVNSNHLPPELASGIPMWIGPGHPGDTTSNGSVSGLTIAPIDSALLERQGGVEIGSHLPLGSALGLTSSHPPLVSFPSNLDPRLGGVPQMPVANEKSSQ